MEIQTENLQKTIRLRLPALRALLATVLSREGVTRGRIAVLLVSRQRITAWNIRHLNHRHATDVIAFDLWAGPGRIPPATLFGDIVVSTDAAVKNSRVYKTSLEREIFLYIVHGVLHLLGYDDHKPSDIKKMRAKEALILKRTGGRVKWIVA
jgi:probable rRNA maturation factor